MSAAAGQFLKSLARSFSAISLYADGHPARVQAADDVYNALTALLAEHPRPTFTLLEGGVVYNNQPLREFRDWAPGRNLAAVDVERFEFTPGIQREEVDYFLLELAVRIGSRGKQAPPPRYHPNIDYGPIRRDDEESADINLGEQRVTVDELHDEAIKKGKVPIELARNVIDTLSMAMQSEGQLLVPLVPLRETDEYTTVHAMNTSVLAMALGEFLNLSAPDVRVIGEAGLLHDVGKVSVPLEILNKPDKLDEREWEIMRTHPVEGAKIILASGGDLTLPAMAAYEHHLKWNGEGGYPDLLWPRRPHRISQFIHLCDAYDAMRTKRPFQAPLPHEEILAILEKGAGVEFEPEIVNCFTRMMREWVSQMVIADGEETS